MNKSKTLLTAKIVLGIAGLTLVMVYASGGCHTKLPSGGAAAYAPGEPLPAGATVAAAVATTLPARVDVVGTVASATRINISARIPAHVTAVHVSAGSVVKAGDPLAELDDRDLQEHVRAAEAQLAQAETEHKRTRDLFASKATTEQAMTAAEAQLAAARSQVDQARVTAGFARIVAPMAGIVTDRRVEPGDLAAPGQPLMALYNPERMRFEAPVPVRLIERVHIGDVVDIVLDRPDGATTGRVVEVVSEVDSLSRTRKVKVCLAPPVGEPLLPGTFGRLWLNAGERPAVLLPAAAVVRTGQLETVGVVENGRVLRRLVKTLPAPGGQVEVQSGLKGGESVVVGVPGEG